MRNPNRKIRKDAKLKGFAPGDPRREQVKAWLDADGPESCAQQIFSQLGISVHGQPVSPSMIYEAVTFWRQQDAHGRVRERAENQARIEADGKNLSAEQMEELLDKHYVIEAAEEGRGQYMEMRDLRLRTQQAKFNAQIALAKIEQGEKKLKQKDRDLDLATRRVRLLEDNAAKAKEQLEVVKKSGGLSPEALQAIEEAARLL